MTKFPPLTHARLREVLDYDKHTGLFFWKHSAGTVAKGYIAGNPTTRGYHDIKIDRRSYKAHRLAWFWVYGDWPSGELDHVNRVCGDNRICNLRIVTKKQNAANASVRSDNKTGYRGVTTNSKGGLRYRARIRADGREIYLGSFSDAAEAANVALTARQKLFGKFTT